VELPKLLNRLNRIDLFHHDSWHTFDHMSWEFHTAFKHLSPKGVLSSHDVISSFLKRNAFSVFCKKHHIKYRAFGNIGVALCNSKAEIDARP
jgi:hypothetical protein